MDGQGPLDRFLLRFRNRHEIRLRPHAGPTPGAERPRGLGGKTGLARRVTEVVMRNPDVALETHAREELGLDPDDLGSPWGAAISSLLTFATGAAVPLLPFVFASGAVAVVAAIVASGVSIFAVGAAMSMLTGRPVW